MTDSVVRQHGQLARPEALLPRSPIVTDLSIVWPYFTDETILVTGAGGSIGGELCRQLATFKPRRLLLLGHGENSLFSIHSELVRQVAADRLEIILADVADTARIRSVFHRWRPNIVFHAAAHKHVPIVEGNLCEAIRNNVLGTRVVSMAAAAAGVAKFIMISTDKAVNPTSVMGATKRIAEMICQAFEGRTPTEFVSVRFGNVLGSRGSVVPTFIEQIERGGPVTITHRDMRRYFMTIPEAAALVLAAGATGRDGQVCVLDMGEPIRIVDLAESLIRAMGREPYRDIEIVETGLRPGEKLYEELLTAEEDLSATTIERIFIAAQQRVDYASLCDKIDALIAAGRLDDTETAIAILRELVPSFSPGSHLTSKPLVSPGVLSAS